MQTLRISHRQRLLPVFILAMQLSVQSAVGLEIPLDTESAQTLQQIHNHAQNLDKWAKMTGTIATAAQLVALGTKALGGMDKEYTDDFNKWLGYSLESPNGYKLFEPFLNRWMSYNPDESPNLYKLFIEPLKDCIIEWQVFPYIYAIAHVNFISNLVAPLAVLSQTIATTHYTLKMNKDLDSLKNTTPSNTQILNNIKQTSNQILAYQWVGGALSLLTSISSVYFSYRLIIKQYITAPRLDRTPFHIIRHKTWITSLISSAIELGVNYYTTRQVVGLTQQLQNDLKSFR